MSQTDQVTKSPSQLVVGRLESPCQTNKITEVLNSIADDISYVFDKNVSKNLFIEFGEARTKISNIILKIREEMKKQQNDKYIDIPNVTIPITLEEKTRLVIEKSEFTKDISSVPDEYKEMFDDFIYIYACSMKNTFIFQDGKYISSSVDVRNVLFGRFRINHFSVVLMESV